ncbi:hypothetical protein BJ322DRAFT_1106319 [Thelephora terrestris]|uniref:Uncharacterized protein n=1 Tax=Thelephora terrestris TaxID=56493 RepID=A0A9P6L9B4_9AGAM|nr:hypothetical protein BJ322DRAFT_1106319 [Thelephora terrestris]
MVVGQPPRLGYQRLAQLHQTHAAEAYLANPPDSTPTGNVPIFPRQVSDLTPSLSGPGISTALPLDTPSTSDPASPSLSQPPSTSTDGSSPTINSSTSESPSQTPSTIPPSTTSRASSSTTSIPSYTSSPGSSITPPPSQSLGFLGSTSLTYSPDTTITSAVVLTINGSPTTSYVLIPTTIGDPGNEMSSSEKTAVIAGSVAGGLVLLILVAAIVLFYRRHQSKKKGFFPTSEPKPRTMLLAGEDLDDDYAYSRQTSNAPTPLPSSIRRVESPYSNVLRSGSSDQSPRLLRPRASDTGSIFHEGGVWPPPSDSSRLVDPILASSNINLSNIIDDVMGSSSGQQNIASGSKAVLRSRDGSGDTMTIRSEGSIYSNDLPTFVPNQGQGHSRGASANSDVPLIPPEPLYLATTHNFGSSPSIQSPQHESGFEPSMSSTSLSNPHGTRTWLDRSPRKISESPSNPFNRNSSSSAPGNGR